MSEVLVGNEVKEVKKELTPKAQLLNKIHRQQARVGIVGLGYVGLPLAVEFAKAGFEVVGLEVKDSKVEGINKGESDIPDVPTEEVRSLVEAKKLRATTDFSVVKDLDAVIICVPTPLRKTKDPDMSYIVNACQSISEFVQPGTVVILESTTYPGTTRELIVPILEKGGLEVEKDFFVCFSPERVDPGNPKYHTKNTPKVIGGHGTRSLQVGKALYKQVIDIVVPVSNTDVAEMVKLLENTYRMINIAMVNEMALQCDRMGIDVWEVIGAAKSKPFGFQAFYPGPGLGGHCIPIDPFYLSWKTKQAGIEARFIELAGYINGQMPEHTISLITDALNIHRKSVNGSRIHILGVAYKPDIDDVRESPALDVMLLLKKRGAELSYSDPFVPTLKLEGVEYLSMSVEEGLDRADCAVVLTPHSNFPIHWIGRWATGDHVLVDTRNAMRQYVGDRANIIRLGGGQRNNASTF
jgi:UDP-N-acetyl-D-glucosamine dehydrogenase